MEKHHHSLEISKYVVANVNQVDFDTNPPDLLLLLIAEMQIVHAVSHRHALPRDSSFFFRPS